MTWDGHKLVVPPNFGCSASLFQPQTRLWSILTKTTSGRRLGNELFIRYLLLSYTDRQLSVNKYSVSYFLQRLFHLRIYSIITISFRLVKDLPTDYHRNPFCREAHTVKRVISLRSSQIGEPDDRLRLHTDRRSQRDAPRCDRRRSENGR